MLKNFFQSPWKTLQNQTISECYTDDNKSKYYGNGNPKDLFKYAKKNWKSLHQGDNFHSKISTRKLLNFLAKFLKEKNYLMNNLNFVRQKYL